MSLDAIREQALDHWAPQPGEIAGEGLEESLEAGKVLYFPRLRFSFDGDEQRFLSEQWADGKAKNISFRGVNKPLQGAQGSAADIEQLKAVIARFAEQAGTLVHGLFPRYRGYLRTGFTSYRTASVEGRVTSWRKDDTRLHVDSFPSNPTGGVRLLRVFTNVNPSGRPRVWRVGEPFPDHARAFFPRASRPVPGSAWLLEKLGITKARRSEYDHYMGQLHDLGKADLEYQQSSPQLTFEFPAGSSWVVFSDQVLHAVMAGQFMLEQTFYLEPEHLVNPASGPLNILEGLAGHPLRNG
jgi:hypothetical protein